MRKFLFILFGAALLASASPAQATGKVTPIDWGRAVDESELDVPLPDAQESGAKSLDLATVTEGVGDLKVIKPNGEMVDFAPGYVLQEGDRIVAQKKGGWFTAFGSEISLGALTDFGFHLEYVTEQSETSVGLVLSVGLLKAKIGYKWFSIRTPEAVLKIKGTEFAVERDAEARVTSVYLYEGAMDVSNLKDETAHLKPGETVAVDAGGKFTMGKLTPELWEELTARVGSPETDVVQDADDAARQPDGPAPAPAKGGLMAAITLGLVAAAIGTWAVLRRKKN